MNDYVKPSIKKKPDNLILHVGRNNLSRDDSSVVAEKIVDLCQTITEELPSTKIGISLITHRNDSADLNEKANLTNKELRRFCRSRDWYVIDHNLDNSHLNSRQLHLNSKGISSLANDFKNSFKLN